MVIEVSQKIVGQIGQEHKTDLGWKTAFASGSQAQTLFVTAELLDFCTATSIVERQIPAFRGQFQCRDVVVVQPAKTLKNTWISLSVELKSRFFCPICTSSSGAST